MLNDYNASRDLTKNKSWCPIPWVTYSINSLGHNRLCVQANSYKPRNDKWTRDKSIGKFTRGTLWEMPPPKVMTFGGSANRYADAENKPTNCQTTDLNAIRNNDFLKEVRSYMLRGERHPVCKRCNQEDDNKVLSRRMADRRNMEEHGFSVDDAFEYTEADGTITDISKVPLLAADIRLSNLCNQKCRMCYPGESSTWYHEWFDTFQMRHIVYEGVKSRKLPKFTGPGNTKMTIDLDENGKARIDSYQLLEDEEDYNARVLAQEKGDPYVWAQSKELYESLSSQSPDMKHIHISGGEPLMITQHYEFLKGYIDAGKAHEITLNYNTNLSNIPERALDLWQHFKLIEIRASIDAPGKINEYIRYPSKWEIVLRNLRLLTTVKKSGKINLNLGIIVTVQVYNVFYLKELVSELNSYDDISFDDIILHMLHDPRYLNITSLPHSVKEVVSDKIRELQAEDKFVKQGEGVINYMYSDDTSDSLDQFFVETRLMDKYRHQRIEESLPELYEMLQPYDPLFHAGRKVQKILDEQFNDAYIINVYEQEISKLKYTHIQVLRDADES